MDTVTAKYIAASSGLSERATQRKDRHTIASFDSHLVAVDAGNHRLPKVSTLNGSKVLLARGSYSIVLMSELSHFCAGCFAGDAQSFDASVVDSVYKY